MFLNTQTSFTYTQSSLHNSSDAKIVKNWRLQFILSLFLALGSSKFSHLKFFNHQKRKVYYSTQLTMKCPHYRGWLWLARKKVSTVSIKLCPVKRVRLYNFLVHFCRSRGLFFPFQSQPLANFCWTHFDHFATDILRSKYLHKFVSKYQIPKI